MDVPRRHSCYFNGDVLRSSKALERIRRVEWEKEGICSECVESKRREWEDEAWKIWREMGEWLELGSTDAEMTSDCFKAPLRIDIVQQTYQAVDRFEHNLIAVELFECRECCVFRSVWLRCQITVDMILISTTGNGLSFATTPLRWEAFVYRKRN